MRREREKERRNRKEEEGRRRGRWKCEMVEFGFKTGGEQSLNSASSPFPFTNY